MRRPFPLLRLTLQSCVPRASAPSRFLRSPAAIVFVAVLAIRALALGSLEATPLSLWHLWTETDEHANVEWSARLAAGNWMDVPPYRAYFSWQAAYGPPEVWERWYQKNAYYAGPLYAYGLAALRRLFGSPFLPARVFQLLLACFASAILATAVRSVARHARPSERDAGSRASFWSAVAAGILYGAYGPLVFHDFFLYRDGPVAHLSTLLLALPLIAGSGSGGNGQERENPPNRAAGTAARRGAAATLLLGLLGGAAVLVKQTLLPLAVVSVYALSRKSGGVARRRAFLTGLLGLAIPLGVLAARNVSAGVPPLTFDTRQAIGLAWGNGFGADATTAPSPDMREILDAAGGSTLKTAALVLESYRDEPLALPKLFLKKLATFFNSYEVPDNANYYFFRDRLPILKTLPVFACLLGIGGVGLCAAFARRALGGEDALLVVVAILTPLTACLLVQTTSRYRAGATGPLALGAGLFLVLTSEEARRRRWRSAGALAAAAGGLSLVPLLPPVIYSARHRYADTMVYATIVESRRGPEAAAAELRRYAEEAKDDRLYGTAVQVLGRWAASGDRSDSLVEPEGIAPPERRLRKQVEIPGSGRTYPPEGPP
jgi:hypothetical protein